MKNEPVLRRAAPRDAAAIRILLEKSDLPVLGVDEHIDDFLVLTSGDELIGSVGLEAYGATALLRSLAVAQEWRGKGYGTRLFRGIIEAARHGGMKELVLLTMTAADFCAKHGFEVVSRDEIDGPIVESVEFRHCCPVSATCMRRRS